MKRLIPAVTAMAAVMILTGARVSIKPVDGSSPEPESGPAASQPSRGLTSRENVKPVPRQERPSEAPTRPTTGRGIDGRGGDGTAGSPVRVRPIGGRSSVGMDRPAGGAATRIMREAQAPAPERHAAAAANTTIIRNIEKHERTEVVPNRNYWHEANGVRYCHTYRGGVHWYGFYHGPHFYWTRYYGGRWWWYDRGFGHWVYWSNDHWWWPGPGGVTYVYVDNAYYPREEAPIEVDGPEPPSAPPADERKSTGGEWKSPDGDRAVQVHGPQSEAFLYDTSGKEPAYIGYLGKNVERVRFSGGKDGKPVRILVDFENGEFSLFTSDGEPMDVEPPPAPSETPAP